MAAKGIHKTLKLQVTKIGNGIIYSKEAKQLHFDNSNKEIVEQDAATFVKECLSIAKENETYQVTVSVTKIK